VIHRYKIQTPKQPHEPEEKLMLPSDTEVSITSEQRANTPTFTDELMKAGSIVALCMALGTVVSSYLGQYITLPGSMIVAAIVRNIGDFTHSFSVEGKGLNAVADISLILFVTMAINSLKLYELVNLAIPMIVILAAQTVLMLAFAWLVFIKLFGKEYDNVMLAVGGIGFGMGATVNGLANMQAIGEKYGSSARAWLIVSIVGAFLIDLVNALVITYMGTL
jgi:ESS family glutamate:Na+ symporter